MLILKAIFSLSKHQLHLLAVLLMFQTVSLAQFSLIDTFSSPHPMYNISGKDGFSFYSEVDKETFVVTIRDLNLQQIAQFRPFSSDDEIRVESIEPLQQDEWSGNEAEYFVRSIIDGTPMTGIYTASGRVVFEVREASRLFRRDDGSTVITKRNRSPNSVDILLLPGLVNIGSFSGTSVSQSSLGDGSAYLQTIQSGSSYPYTRGVRRYNDDFSIRYSFEIECSYFSVISGSVLNDNSDNLFFAKDSTFNNEEAHYLALIDSVGNIKMDTFLKSTGSLQTISRPEESFFEITLFSGEKMNHYVDKKTLTFIDFPDAGFRRGIFNGQEVLFFNFADTSRTIIPYYDPVTYDRLGVIPYSIINDGIRYTIPTPLIPQVGETFGGASFVYFAYLRDTTVKNSALFVDDQFQPIGQFFTPGFIHGSYQYAVDGEAYFTTNVIDGSAGGFRPYSLFKFKYQSSSTSDLLNSLLNVYPNPSNGWITIEDQYDTPISSLSLVSNLGQIVKTWERPNTGEKLVFDVPKGIYNLVVRMENDQIRSKRIVIQ